MKQYFKTSQSEKEDKQTMTAYIKTLITIGLDLREREREREIALA